MTDTDKHNAGKENLFKDFLDEFGNYIDITEQFEPSLDDIPKIDTIDIYGKSMPLGEGPGGDHIIFIDFNKVFQIDDMIERAIKAEKGKLAEKLEASKKKAGILISDVSGHKMTDFTLNAPLHVAFLTAATYEMSNHGEITVDLLERLNNVFHKFLKDGKFLALLYGEISEDGKFRFIQAGQPDPVVFSYKHDKIVDLVSGRFYRSEPLGIRQSKDSFGMTNRADSLGYKGKYNVNQIELQGSKDTVVLFTDGADKYVVERLEQKLRELKKIRDYSAREMYDEIKEDFLKFEKPIDDASFVIVKRR